MKTENQVIEKAKELLHDVKTRKELVGILSKQFSLSEKTIDVYFWKNNFKTNFPPFRFNKGNTPWSKGMKGYTNAGSLKKGHKPWNKDLKVQTNTGRTHFKKGATAWNKKIPMREDSKAKLSESLKGRRPWNKDKKGYHFKTKRSPEYIEKLRNRKRDKWSEDKKKSQSQGRKEFFEKHPEHRKVLSDAQLRTYANRPELRRIHSETKKRLIRENPEILKKMLGFRRPNFSESKFDSILTENFPNLFKFVGYDFSYIKKFGAIPDWICEEKKLIIEFCGEKFHTEKEMKEKAENYSKSGYKTLVIWYPELKESMRDLDKRNKLLGKIKNFTR